MLHVFKTYRYFKVPNKGANSRLKRQLNRDLTKDEIIYKLVYTEGCVSVISPRMRDYMFMFTYAKKESVLYYEEELPHIEDVLKKHNIVYAIYNAKTDECITPYPAKIVEPIDIALTQIQTINS